MLMGYITILLALAAPNESVYQSDSVHLVAHIQSNLYTYTITNHGDSPIVDFEIPQYATYSFTAPLGWQISGTAGTFKAWTNDPSSGIEPANSGTFSMRVSSQGATLGELTAKVQFQNGREVSIPKVWAPVAESRWYYYLIVGILVVIFLLHYVILRQRKRRNVSSTPAA
jgi:hypothetical protein